MADVHLDNAAITDLLSGPTGPVFRDLTRRAIRVQNAAKALCPVDTGRLRSSITYQVRRNGNTPYAVIGTNVKYAPYVHEGTGIYAGRGPIRPVHARFLVFRPKGSLRTVFARQVRGVRPRPFLRDALAAARG